MADWDDIYRGTERKREQRQAGTPWANDMERRNDPRGENTPPPHPRTEAEAQQAIADLRREVRELREANREAYLAVTRRVDELESGAQALNVGAERADEDIARLRERATEQAQRIHGTETRLDEMKSTIGVLVIRTDTNHQRSEDNAESLLEMFAGLERRVDAVDDNNSRTDVWQTGEIVKLKQQPQAVDRRDVHAAYVLLDQAISEMKAQCDLSNEGVADTLRFAELALARLEGVLR